MKSVNSPKIKNDKKYYAKYYVDWIKQKIDKIHWLAFCENEIQSWKKISVNFLSTDRFTSALKIFWASDNHIKNDFYIKPRVAYSGACMVFCSQKYLYVGLEILLSRGTNAQTSNLF